MRIAFKTFGCKANSLDTDALHLEALRRGHEIVAEKEPADAYVINSCTVTAAADRDARSQVLRYKRKNPLALVGVVGCYAQVAKEELLAISQVDFVVGTAGKTSILDHFEAAARQESIARDQVQPSTGFLPVGFPGSRYARAVIKVQDGCNFSCSFCIIPQARGRSRSLPEDTVLRQIEDAATEGFREVVLTGIHLAHYGWDRGTDLMNLLRRVLAGAGPRVRVSTLDPFEIPDELVDWLGREPRLCPHLHIAIQSGSDRVLAGMRRVYKAAEFTEVTAKIERRHPDTFVGVDVIVGFPGETDEEFEATVRCLESSYWTKLHVFPFSARKNTRAWDLPHGVPPAAITERSARLRELSTHRYQTFLSRQVGKERDVLLERPSAKHAGLWLGHTENYVPTLSHADTAGTREIVRSSVVEISGDRAITRTIP